MIYCLHRDIKIYMKGMAESDVESLTLVTEKWIQLFLASLEWKLYF